MSRNNVVQDHSNIWVFQTWAAFILSVTATTLGVINLPVDPWVKGFMGMGIIFTVSSSITLSKTQRDLHEGKKISSKIEEAKVEKLLAEHL